MTALLFVFDGDDAGSERQPEGGTIYCRKHGVGACKRVFCYGPCVRRGQPLQSYWWLCRERGPQRLMVIRGVCLDVSINFPAVASGTNYSPMVVTPYACAPSG
jgi:hypothetical protein